MPILSGYIRIHSADVLLDALGEAYGSDAPDHWNADAKFQYLEARSILEAAARPEGSQAIHKLEHAKPS